MASPRGTLTPPGTRGIAPGRDADQHLPNHPAIQRVDIGHRLERGQAHLLAIGAHARAAHGDLAAAEHHLTAHRASPRGSAVSDVRIPRAADRAPISSSIASSTFRPERTASSNSSLRASTRRSTSGKWRGDSTAVGGERLCKTASWRLLF